MGPYLKSFILCDNITKDISGKPVLSGIFDKIKAFGYPSTKPFYIVTEWVVEEGSYREEIKVLTASKDKVYFDIPVREFSANKKLEIKKLILPVNKFPLYGSGGVWFQIYLNEKLYSEFPLIIETKVSRIIGGKK